MAYLPADQRFFHSQAPCRRGHGTKRYASDGRCVECAALRRKKAWASDREGQSQAAKRWRENNRDRHLENFRTWRAANLDKDRAASRKWQSENPAKVIAALAKRKASILRAMPQWVNQEQLAEVYGLRDLVSKETGVPHDVDHIVPLQGKTVCGLHVPWNLRVIPRIENRKKGNRLIDGENHNPQCVGATFISVKSLELS